VGYGETTEEWRQMEERDVKGRFLPGHAKLGGAKPGARSLKFAVLRALDNVHARGRVGWLESLAREDPKSFAVLISKLLPQELKAELTTVSERIVEIRDFTGVNSVESSASEADKADPATDPRPKPVVH
jgi:hypothetical protein